MKKIFLYSITLMAISLQISQCTFASSNGVSGSMAVAIKKYKYGNYTGCLQDCQNIASKTPSNALAYYYMAMSYVQAGKKNEAINAYSKVLALKTNAKVLEYAATGKRCLETPDQCRLDVNTATTSTPEMDKLIASPIQGDLSETVKSDFTQKRLNGLKNQINNGKELDDYYFRKFKDYSNQRTEAESNEKLAQTQPTKEEIAAAMKVLNDAGMNPYNQDTLMQTQPQNAELVQLNALMGNSSQSKSNDVMNMIPMMMAQSKDKDSNVQYSPQVMQAMILNSMMSDLNFNLNQKQDNN